MTAATTSESAPARFDEERELCVALWLTALVLATLTAVKPLGGIPIVGTVGFTIAAALQLYLPLWRAERLGLPYAAFGLSSAAWRRDLALVGVLCLVTFPPYAFLHHIYMTSAHEWLAQAGLHSLAVHVPRRALSPSWPQGALAWLLGAGWLLQLVATHTLGVALPEETFYRGYLQGRLERRWPAATRFFGVPLGRAAVLTAFLFAAGHFLGEWNPLRFGPFVPALAFAWLRSASGTVLGAVTFHAACNVYGALLFELYRPG